MKTLSFNVERLSAEQMNPIIGGSQSSGISNVGPNVTNSTGADQDTKISDADADVCSPIEDLFADGF